MPPEGRRSGMFTPEAAAGPIALVKEGDIAKIDIISKKLDILVDDATWSFAVKNRP